MKAWVLEEIGEIKYRDVDRSEPNADWVTVRVEAVGICGSDIPRIYTNGAHVMPIIPGHEFAGVVSAVGTNVDKSWLKKPVGVYPLIPCRQCDCCKKGLFEMCKNYDYIGSRRDGAFAEYVSVPAANLIELPEGTSFEEAAMLEPMAVAVNALRKGTDNLTLDRSLPIVVGGLGTIGMLLAMFLKEASYNNLYLLGNKDGQRSRIQSIGISADCFYDIREGCPQVEDAAVYFECVGRNETVAQAIEMTGAEGVIVYVGNPYSDIKLDRDIYWKILRNQLIIKGVWNSRFNGEDFDDWHYVLSRLEGKTISPSKMITHRFNIKDAQKGLEIMKNKTEDYCKIILKNESFA